MSHMYDEVPLSTSNDEIRLLLLDGKRLYLQMYTLHDAPDYITVSYAWSEWTDNQVDGPQNVGVNVGDQEFEVTVQPNISLFLKQAKENLPSGTHLWIDALCIDQSNTPDRNYQVSLMKTIYSNAIFTIVWLGEHDSDTTYMSYLQLNKLTQHDPEMIFPPWNSDFDRPSTAEYHEWLAKYGYRYSHSDDRVAGPDVLHNLWIVLRGMCRVRYWTRLWVVQEFALSKRIRIWLGGTLFELGDLARAIYKVICLAESECRVDWISTFAKARSTVPSLRAASDLCMARCDPAFGTATPPNFETTYKRFGSDRIASDRHDYVYGLLSLCQEEIVPDYSKSLASLLWEILQLPANRDCVWLGQQLFRDMNLRNESSHNSSLILETVDMFTSRFHCVYEEWRNIESQASGLNFPHASLRTQTFVKIDVDGRRSEPLYVVTKREFAHSKIRVHRILGSVLLLLSTDESLQSGRESIQGVGVLIGSLRRYQHIPTFPALRQERLAADSKVLDKLLDHCESAFRRCYIIEEHAQRNCMLLTGQALGLAIHCESYDAALKYGESDRASLGLPMISYDEADDE